MILVGAIVFHIALGDAAVLGCVLAGEHVHDCFQPTYAPGHPRGRAKAWA